MSDTSEIISVRLVNTPEELEIAQALRYQVFYEEYGAEPDEKMAAEKRDFDKFDEVADHLVVIDNAHGDEGKIVGTYRLLRRSIAEQHGGFYSSSEYDISPILNSETNILELGRSCVLPEYRSRAVLQLLWQGISGYVTDYDIELLFGCASLHSTDIKNLAISLSYLHHFHLAPDNLRAKAIDNRYINMNIVPKDEINQKAAFNDLPPLIKGYLRIGATIGDGAVIDPQFNTTDVFIAMPTHFVKERYRKHYERKNQKPLPNSARETA